MDPPLARKSSISASLLFRRFAVSHKSEFGATKRINDITCENKGREDSRV